MAKVAVMLLFCASLPVIACVSPVLTTNASSIPYGTNWSKESALTSHGARPDNSPPSISLDSRKRADLERFVATETAEFASGVTSRPSARYPAKGHSAETARLDSREVAAIAKRCASTTPSAVLVAISRVESSFSPLLIGINGPGHRRLNPGSKDQAISAAEALISAHQDVDLGLAQINSRNLAWLGMSVEDAFDPCRSLVAASRILERGYTDALRRGQQNTPILQMAYSYYNTGSSGRGLTNGYVAKVEAAAKDGRP